MLTAVEPGTYYIQVRGCDASISGISGAFTMTIQQAVSSSDAGSAVETIRRLTSYSYYNRYPSWSPDGQQIAFSRL